VLSLLNHPLHLLPLTAAFSGHPEVARVLLENRANTKEQNQHGDPPTEVAKYYMNQKIVRMLADPEAAGANARKEMKKAAAAKAAEDTAKREEAIKTQRRKEVRHRRQLEVEQERALEKRKQEDEALKEQSMVLLQGELAEALAPMSHLPS